MLNSWYETWRHTLIFDNEDVTLAPSTIIVSSSKFDIEWQRCGKRSTLRFIPQFRKTVQFSKTLLHAPITRLLRSLESQTAPKSCFWVSKNRLPINETSPLHLFANAEMRRVVVATIPILNAIPRQWTCQQLYIHTYKKTSRLIEKSTQAATLPISTGTWKIGSVAAWVDFFTGVFKPFPMLTQNSKLQIFVTFSLDFISNFQGASAKKNICKINRNCPHTNPRHKIVSFERNIIWWVLPLSFLFFFFFRLFPTHVGSPQRMSTQKIWQCFMPDALPHATYWL